MIIISLLVMLTTSYNAKSLKIEVIKMPVCYSGSWKEYGSFHSAS